MVTDKQVTSQNMSSPTRRRGSKIDMDILSAPERQEAVFQGILERRDGSVLTRSTILKSDHFGAGREGGVDLKLLGAPNFRQANLNVFGVAQPTIAGLATVLRLLRAGPHRECTPEQSCTWFSTREEPLIYVNGRPFVLRDRESPFENIRSYAGIAASRLEQMELRLKADIIAEASRNNGLLLVHDEIEEHQIVPCLTAIDTIKTSAEVFSHMQESGFCVNYQRVPLSNEHSPTDIDDYVKIFETLPVQKHAVIFSCGIGVGRTTYAMIIGLLLRRAIIYRETGNDPFSMEIIPQTEKTTHSILRLVSVLEQGLRGNASHSSAVEWTLARGSLIDNLTAAIMGNYHVIVELVRVLENGSYCKQLVDEAIDRCIEPLYISPFNATLGEALLNIREHILINRVKHQVSEESNALDTGIAFLERYFSLIAFCAFIEDSQGQLTFSEWMHDRRDVLNMLQHFRRQTAKLRFFRPVDDLTALSARQRLANSALTATHPRLEGMAEYNVIKSRAGSVLCAHTILKIDHWTSTAPTILTGAPNFRQIHGMDIFASAQPTLEALRSIVGMMHERLEAGEMICWINVREEPVIYVDNEPYVLRDQYATLRNIKSFSGITSDRLEQMERRLKEDILNEASMYNQKILVHCESAPDSIYPCWLSLEKDSDVLTLAEVFQQLHQSFPSLQYRRLPITAEEPPEAEHFDAIMKMVLMNPPGKCHLIFNCQMGVSRSTVGAVIAALVNRWRCSRPDDEGRVTPIPTVDMTKKVTHYRIIHSILRVIRNGLLGKAIVDEVIDMAGSVVNLREIIERYRRAAEESSDPTESHRALRKGVAALKRYALLILFQGYLASVRPNVELAHLEPFSAWLGRHQEFRTLLDELDSRGRGGTAVEVLNEEAPEISPGGGVAASSEVLDVVKHRRGQVLAPMTILKFDHFPGCQKMSLPDRVEGAPNFRQVSLDDKLSVFGLAMPTKQGFISILRRVEKAVQWFCLREEPVLYVNGRPYVLRIVKDPVTNLEMTGIISERVEMMEDRLKIDVLREAEQFGGKLLLHEEDALSGNIIPVWETVSVENVETTSEIVQCIRAQGYPCDYVRIPITDEQAPIPSVFDHLLQLTWDPDKSPVFNCQMGRGRTTTGMVISVLLYLVRNQHLVPSPELLTESLEDLSLTSEEERERYLAGEYKIITKVASVLEHGKKAKRLLDAAIDRCSHVQNLRTAIYDFKLQEGGGRGLNYLLRYFFLVVFAEYLVELHANNGSPELEGSSFVAWLNERREITNMVSRRDLLDFS